MRYCNFEESEYLIKYRLNNLMPGIYYTINYSLILLNELTISEVLIKNPEKLLKLLEKIFDKSTIRIIIKEGIVQPLITHYGLPQGYTYLDITELFFSNQRMFSTLINMILC